MAIKGIGKKAHDTVWLEVSQFHRELYGSFDLSDSFFVFCHLLIGFEFET
jgi:hypothetical protein